MIPPMLVSNAPGGAWLSGRTVCASKQGGLRDCGNYLVPVVFELRKEVEVGNCGALRYVDPLWCIWWGASAYAVSTRNGEYIVGCRQARYLRSSA